MTFQEMINDYLKQLDCTARELSAASGISTPVISRYRRGTQSPEPDGEQWQKLAAGIAALAQERGLKEITQESVETTFRDALAAQEDFDKARFCRNLNELLETFAQQPDGYVICYTYGDFYSHDAIRSSRVTVENGEMIITEITQ